jgi:hypothetical protein
VRVKKLERVKKSIDSIFIIIVNICMMYNKCKTFCNKSSFIKI